MTTTVGTSERRPTIVWGNSSKHQSFIAALERCATPKRVSSKLEGGAFPRTPVVFRALDIIQFGRKLSADS